MFVELVPLLKDRTVLITVASIDGKLKVNVIPAKAKEGEEQALTTPLSFTGSAAELDAELGSHLTSYVHSHVELRNTLAEVKAEMDAAAKAARQKVKTTQPAPKSDPPKTTKNPHTRARTEPDITPSLFAGQPKPWNRLRRRKQKEEEQRRHDRSKIFIAQLHVQRCETAGPRPEDDPRGSKGRLQPSISRTGDSRYHRPGSSWRSPAIQLCASNRNQRVSGKARVR